MAPATKATQKKKSEHPTYAEMIKEAITVEKQRKGSSRQAITKFVKTRYSLPDSCQIFVKQSLKRLITSGVIEQVSGNGASGSFKMASKKKTAVAVVKKPVAKKPAVAVKKVVKKSVKKTPPKKAVKSSPKKKATPKVTLKKTVKSKSVKAKKTPVKSKAVSKTRKSKTRK